MVYNKLGFIDYVVGKNIAERIRQQKKLGECFLLLAYGGFDPRKGEEREKAHRFPKEGLRKILGLDPSKITQKKDCAWKFFVDRILQQGKTIETANRKCADFYWIEKKVCI